MSLWIAVGANHNQVAVRAGHTSVSVVLERYGHLFPERDDELIDNLQQRATASRQQVPHEGVTPPVHRQDMDVDLGIIESGIQISQLSHR